MIKTLLIDLDGVVIIREGYFSQRYAKDFGNELDKENILSFFKTTYKLCAVGKADLRVELTRVLSQWGWKQSIDELLEYWFSGERSVDQQLVEYLQRIRSSGVETYLVTDNEKYRLADLRKLLPLDQWFDGVFCSCEIGFTKDQPEFHKVVLQRLDNSDPHEIVFCDDDEKNNKIASALGVVARTYSNIDQLKQDLNELGLQVQ